jgi:hypothetical protein
MDIYCTNCGAKNDTSSQFCENCGSPLTKLHSTAPPVTPPLAPPRPRTWISKAGSVGALVAILGFFLPWLSVSCSAAGFAVPSTTVSGSQIASGHIPMLDKIQSLGSYLGDYGLGELGLGDLGLGSTGAGALTSQVAHPAVWLILVIGLLGLLPLLGGKRGGKIAIGVGALGVIALIIVGINIGSLNSQINMVGFKIKTQAGLVFEWLGFLYLMGMGVLSLLYDSDISSIPYQGG